MTPNVTDSVSNSFSFTEPGNYTAYASGYYNGSYIDTPIVSFAIEPELKIQANILKNRTVEFTCSGFAFAPEGAWLIIFQSDTQIKEVLVKNDEIYTISFDDVGEYSAQIVLYYDVFCFKTEKSAFSVTDNTITVLEDEKKCVINVPKERLQVGTMIVALYKKDSLIDTRVQKVYNVKGNIQIDIPFEEKPDTLKIMFWDNFLTLKPLTDIEIIPRSEWIVK